MHNILTASKLMLAFLMATFCSYSFGFGHFDDYSAYLYCYKGPPDKRQYLGQLFGPSTDTLINQYGPNSDKYAMHFWGSEAQKYPVISISGESSIYDTSLPLVDSYVNDKKNTAGKVDSEHPNAPLLSFEDIVKDGQTIDGKQRAHNFCKALSDACRAQYGKTGDKEIYSVFAGANTYQYIYNLSVYVKHPAGDFQPWSCSEQFSSNTESHRRLRR